MAPAARAVLVTTRISGSSCCRESPSVRGYIGYSDKHDAEHGVRSGRKRLQAKSGTMKRERHLVTIYLERTGPVCERSEMKEHRTVGGADGMERRRTFRVV
jgi:hypothetical protein